MKSLKNKNLKRNSASHQNGNFSVSQIIEKFSEEGEGKLRKIPSHQKTEFARLCTHWKSFEERKIVQQQNIFFT